MGGWRVLGCAWAIVGISCVGTVENPADRRLRPPASDGFVVGEMGMRRLTAHELDNVLFDLVGEARRPARVALPEDVRAPFDNRWRNQTPSSVLVRSLETLAIDVAAEVRADPTRMNEVVGCTPTAPNDEGCLRDFVARITRRAWRRDVTDEEVDELVQLALPFAEDSGDFGEGVEIVLRALLQSPELLYRIEIGTPAEGDPGLYRLDGFEIASRMSFLIWGSAPDDALLDAAADGTLDTPDGRRAMAASMIDDDRARAQVDRFHAMWLGYETLGHEPTLSGAMRAETRALMDRVVFDERRSWLDLFALQQTYVDDALATHYGLTAPGAPGWVDLAGTGRQGLLAQGSFLSAAANPADTSPTRRGVLVLERLLCETVLPPPPDVPADDPPSAELGECKEDQYAAHRMDSSCSGCHQAMDGIGFGLENYDFAGAYRAHDDGRPQCVISGEGEVVGQGRFNGPAELSDLLIASGRLETCAVQHTLEFALGRELESDEGGLIRATAAEFEAGGHRFDALLIALVGNEAFAYRREVEAE